MPEDNKPTYLGFVQFVEAQVPSRAINHKGTWCDCAIGDYLNGDFTSQDELKASSFAGYILRFKNYALYRALGDAPDDELQTYGELNQFINQL